ncbi:MAG: hypothetical protein NC310_08770 [Roseburia sp.]|nr:hypothetical protein [Anaeroplasma bactoclasticum]MCM1197140.1 hypothetical protein [Roseburia sp.]MCM1557520.1 hypothetical protein [Anaeroplasma bactoclasticum]
MKIRKIFLIMLIIGFVFTLFGCSKENVDDEFEEPFFESALVTEFMYEGKKFISTDIRDSKNEFDCFFGYLINAEDLEKWQDYDHDDSLIYVLDTHNSLYRVDITGKYTNRFEIYSMDNNADALAISYRKIIYRVREVEK